jgi:hypothetical protein
MAWYDAALRVRLAGEEHGSGRNDLLMATYLPYCARFVTNDGAQAKRLREIAVEADLDSEVLSYEEFANSFCALRGKRFTESGVSAATKGERGD